VKINVLIYYKYNLQNKKLHVKVCQPFLTGLVNMMTIVKQWSY